MGLEAIAAPLFEVEPLAWEAPEPGAFGAVLLTSANAPRHAGAQLALYTHLPCYAVGEATARAAQAAGFSDVRCGPGDGNALLDMVADAAHRSLLHLAGRDHLPVEHPKLRIDRRAVYAAKAARSLSVQAAAAIANGATILVHSPRAGALLDQLASQAGLERSRTNIAAISAPTAAAVGTGWKSVHAAAWPRDHALLELAAKLCQAAAVETGNR